MSVRFRLPVVGKICGHLSRLHLSFRDIAFGGNVKKIFPVYINVTTPPMQ